MTTETILTEDYTHFFHGEEVAFIIDHPLNDDECQSKKQYYIGELKEVDIFQRNVYGGCRGL